MQNQNQHLALLANLSAYVAKPILNFPVVYWKTNDCTQDLDPIFKRMTHVAESLNLWGRPYEAGILTNNRDPRIIRARNVFKALEYSTQDFNNYFVKVCHDIQSRETCRQLQARYHWDLMHPSTPFVKSKTEVLQPQTTMFPERKRKHPMPQSVPPRVPNFSLFTPTTLKGR